MTNAEIAAKLDSRTDKAIMDADRVRPAQVGSYLPLLPQVATILGDREVTNAHGVGAGLPPEVRKQLMDLMGHLPTSHRWVKGLIGVYVQQQQDSQGEQLSLEV